MMKKFVIAVLVAASACCSGPLLAQNLVPDPGFEDWNGTIGINPNTLGGLTFWNEVNGTPDHHHQLNAPGSNLTSLEPCPQGNGQNQCGEPYEGQAVLGVYKGNGVDGTKEWAAIQLDQALVAGTCYRASFWVQNKKDNPNFIMETNQWGMFFSMDAVPAFDPNTLDFNTVANQFVTCEQVINDTIWHKVEWTYEADNNYPFIYVGYMGNVVDATTNAWSMSGSVGFYAWIDQVEVEEVIAPLLAPSPDITACAGDEFSIYADSNMGITWSTGVQGDTLTVTELLPGIYTYDVFGGQGTACELMETITVNVLDCNCPFPITANVNVMAATNCPGTLPCDGTATLTSVDGLAPYTYNWGDPNNTNAPNVAGLCAGDYTFAVTDSNGCIDSVDYSITGPVEADFALTVTDVSCAGLMDGSIETTFIAGEAPYTFEWDGAPSTEDINGVDEGWHYITVFDNVGCTYQDSAFVDLSATQIVNVVIPDEICIDAVATVVDATLSNGVWTGTGIIDAATGLFDPALSGAGTFILSYIDASDCNTEYQVSVTVRELPLVSFTTTPTFGCADLEVDFDMAGPVIPGTYLWELGDGTMSVDAPPFTHTYTEEGSYDVSLTLIDALGCANSSALPGLIQVIAQPEADFTYTPGTPTDYDNMVEFTDVSIGSTSWYWDFGNGMTSNEPSPSIAYDGPGDYPVFLRVESGAGCVDSVYKFVRYRGEVVFYVPSSFTPDGDGLNDYFQIVTDSDIDLFTITIFDRWGTVVYQSQDIEEKWGGGVQSVYATDEHLYYAPDGIYSYIITFNNKFGGASGFESGRMYGSIYVIR